MTAFKKIIAAAVAATTAFGALGTAAHAGDYYSRPYGGGYGYGQAPGYRHYAPPPPPVYYHERRRDRTGEKIAKGVAIGVGALILGSILANEARRHRY